MAARAKRIQAGRASGSRTRARRSGQAVSAPARELISPRAIAALNQSFNRFLGIDRKGMRLVARHRAQLSGLEGFAEAFYAYLLSHTGTRKVLQYYEKNGGSIDALVRTQRAHLDRLLAARTDRASAAEMIRLGEVHFRRGVEPIWVMGGYQLYAEYLLTVMRESEGIPQKLKNPLRNAILQLVFRDLGLMTEGYWLAAAAEIRRERDEALRLRERIEHLHANIPQLLWSVDVRRNEFLYVSPVARQIAGADVELPIPCLTWTVEAQRKGVEEAWARALAGERAEVETQVRTPDGALRWFRRVFYPYRDSRDRTLRIDGIMEDVTDARELGERVRLLATTDSLTGLPNRVLFRDRLERAVVQTERGSTGGTVLMFLDLDRFKEINDALGHLVGDRVLKAIAGRIGLCLRESDTVARIGGDEFGILLPHAEDPLRTANEVAEKVLVEITRPVHVDGQEFFVGASIGIVVSPEHGVDPDVLIRRADAAMYVCKGRDTRHLVYDPQIETSASQRLEISNDLQRALDRHEFVLHYQPIVAADGRVEAVEALIRWDHPRLGRIAPDEFIPLAERSGLIVPMTDWVIEAALAMAKRLRALGHPARIAVNISGRVFRDPGLPARVKRLLDSQGASPDALEVEVTENVLMSEAEQVTNNLTELRRLGVRTAMDDFGSGLSSLALLKHLPIDRIKIDRSLIIGMEEDAASATIVRSIIKLGHDLGRTVVAEGVESDEVLAWLRNWGCDAAQGYHLCRPLPAAELERRLASCPG